MKKIAYIVAGALLLGGAVWYFFGTKLKAMFSTWFK